MLRLGVFHSREALICESESWSRGDSTVQCLRLLDFLSKSGSHRMSFRAWTGAVKLL